MLDLTPNDVRTKRHDLPYRLRGYDPAIVDDFLHQVADTMERLVEENRILADRLTNAEEQLQQYREREQTIVQTLTLAEEMREERRLQTEQEADLIRSQALNDAERIRMEAHMALEEARDELRRLHARRVQLLNSWQAFLRHELSETEIMGSMLRQRGEDIGGVEIDEHEPIIPSLQAADSRRTAFLEAKTAG